MDENPPPPPPVTKVRAYRRLPKLTIPTIESIRAKGTFLASDSSVVPSPSSASTQISLRAPKRTCWQKMDHVLTTYGFDSLGEFLSVLFHPLVPRGETLINAPRHFLHQNPSPTFATLVRAYLRGQHG
ncbi:hypothetical protein GGX14DRAFT_698003 [Mycena pura]|uniref:Uncharacterized protein n=1 Tax=Mycena pura TaxID=153505 RepID=A0AAD6YAN0_9AGAR|nr:hypothetical protein GGX14DRAFT_698003 [Mycena pura]